MLFFTEGAINISAIAGLVQDDNQEMALVGYVWSPAGRETNGTDWRTRCPHPWRQQRTGGNMGCGVERPVDGRTCQETETHSQGKNRRGSSKRRPCQLKGRNFYKKKNYPLYTSQGL